MALIHKKVFCNLDSNFLVMFMIVMPKLQHCNLHLEMLVAD